MNELIEPVVRALSRWAQESQRTACRNAMVASTALAERRRERREVEEFLHHALAPHPVEAEPSAQESRLG